jgi:hypothetical protein
MHMWRVGQVVRSKDGEEWRIVARIDGGIDTYDVMNFRGQTKRIFVRFGAQGNEAG